jgi:hypothetical protein
MLSKRSKMFLQKGVASWRDISLLRGRHLGRERVATIGFDDLSGAFDAVGAGAFAIAVRLPEELTEADFEKIRVFKEVSHPLPLIVSCKKLETGERELAVLATFLENLAIAGVSGVCLNAHSIETAEQSLLKMDAIVRLKNLGLAVFTSLET